MANGKSSTNVEILRYALTHLEAERDQIQAKIDHIRTQLGQRVSAPASPAAAALPGRKKRNLSASARKRIAAAQKKRWEEHRKAKAAKAGQ